MYSFLKACGGITFLKVETQNRNSGHLKWSLK